VFLTTFTITTVIKEANLPISLRCELPGCFNRGLQLPRTLRIYDETNKDHTRLRRTSLQGLLFGSSLFAIVFFGGSLLLLARLLFRTAVALLASVLGVVFLPVR
jgi:hypothetical protein